MDSSLGTLTARPSPFQVDGKTYQIHPLRLIDWGEVQKWCDRQQPNPFAIASAQLGTGLFTVAQEKELIAQALRISMEPKPKLGRDPECNALLNSPEGVAKVVQLAIIHSDPNFTEAQALALINSLDAARAEELHQALDIGFMLAPEEGGPGPKASTGGTSSTPP